MFYVLFLFACGTTGLQETIQQLKVLFDVNRSIQEEASVKVTFADTTEFIVKAEFFQTPVLNRFRRLLGQSLLPGITEVTASSAAGEDKSWHKPQLISDFYFKPLSKDDEHPENDMLCQSYYAALGIGDLIVRTCLLKLAYNDGIEQFVQVSKKTGHCNLKEYLEKTPVEKRKIDPVDCAWHFITGLLLKPGDAKAENFVVDTSDPNRHRVYSIDNEMLGRPYLKYYRDRDGYVCGIHSLFFRKKDRQDLGLKETLPPDIFEKLRQINPHALLLRWQKKMDMYQEELVFFKNNKNLGFHAFWDLKGKKAFEDHISIFQMILQTVEKERTYENLLENCHQCLNHYYKDKTEKGVSHEDMILRDSSVDTMPYFSFPGKSNGMKNDIIQLSIQAELGDVASLFLIAQMYEIGDGIEQNIQEAERLYKEAAQKNHIESQWRLGLIYFLGFDMPFDLHKKLLWWRKASELGCPKATYHLGFYFKDETDFDGYVEKSGELGYKDGQFMLASINRLVYQNFSESIRWYQKAAEQGVFHSMFMLASFYHKGVGGFGKNLEKACNWYQRSADFGRSDAYFHLGSVFYNEKKDLRQHVQKALYYFIKGDEDGDDQCQLTLGNFYFHGGEGVEKSQSKAAFYWEKSAKAGNAEAQFMLALHHLDCLCCNDKDFIDPIKYIYWMKRAAEQGHAEAQYLLGGYYFEEKDFINAVDCFQKSAEQGDARAQNDLGVCFHHEKGVLQDMTTAAEWYQKSAKQGIKEAFDNLDSMAETERDSFAALILATLYEKGDGTQKNYIKAIEYYKMLAEKKPICYFKIGQLYEEGGYRIRKNVAIAKANYQLALNHGFQPAQEALTRLSTFR